MPIHVSVFIRPIIDPVLSQCKTSSGTELLFMSKEAIFDDKKALRGGVPVCFPQFSDMGPGAPHGFARNTKFEVAEGGLDPSGINAVHHAAKLVLQHSDETLAAWPVEFTYAITFFLSDHGIEIDVEVSNLSSQEVSFTTALHTYFAVEDIHEVAISGLHAVNYLDSLQGRILCHEPSEFVTFRGEVDRIYVNTPQEIVITDQAAGRSIMISKAETWFDAVVWNPWIAKSKRTADLQDDEYKNFVCVEVGRCGSPVILPSQETWYSKVAYQSLERPVVDLPLFKTHVQKS